MGCSTGFRAGSDPVIGAIAGPFPILRDLRKERGIWPL
jgi:hypothetical protein